jgi:hypothetical protein
MRYALLVSVMGFSTMACASRYMPKTTPRVKVVQTASGVAFDVHDDRSRAGRLVRRPET